MVGTRSTEPTARHVTTMATISGREAAGGADEEDDDGHEEEQVADPLGGLVDLGDPLPAGPHRVGRVGHGRSSCQAHLLSRAATRRRRGVAQAGFDRGQGEVAAGDGEVGVVQGGVGVVEEGPQRLGVVGREPPEPEGGDLPGDGVVADGEGAAVDGGLDGGVAEPLPRRREGDRVGTRRRRRRGRRRRGCRGSRGPTLPPGGGRARRA